MSSTRKRGLRDALVAALIAPGCGAGQIGYDGDGGASDAAMAAASGASLPWVAIDPPTASVSCAARQVWIGRVQGRVLDFADRPVSRGSVNICGTTCIPTVTGADGRFDVDVSHCFGTNDEYPHGAVFWFDGVGPRTDVFVDFNPASRTRAGTVRLLSPIYVGAYADGGSARAPHTSNTALRLVDGLGFAMRVVPSTLEYPIGDTEETLRAVRFPLARLPAYNGPTPSVMYAIGPMDTALHATVPVEFPNVGRLPPHTPVEIIAVGNHQSASRPPAGVLGPVDIGHVSPDGQRVVADNGLRFFGLVGYRPFSHP